MIRVLLVHPHYIWSEVPLGLMYLSAMLKTRNHQVDLFYLNLCQWQKGEDPQVTIERNFREKLQAFSPDIVGFSVMSTAFDLSLSLARIAKEHNKIVILGGPHPTVDPEGTICQESVDMICLGEGEHALLEIVTRIENGEEITNVANIWIKDAEGIHKNPLRPLVQDLDSLPLPDRTLLETESFDRKIKGANFITGRGCPYRCSYCINEHLQRIYHGLGRFVRFRKVEAVIEEIKEYVRKWHPKLLVFSDEVLTMRKGHLLAFCEAYAREVGLPFQCQTRANTIDAETAEALKMAGCVLVSIGIESGNEYIRNTVLNRRMSEESIRRAFGFLREAGVPAGAFNVIGISGETEKMIRETIRLNRKVHPVHVHCTILMPFKGTAIRRIYEENGLIQKEPSASYYVDVTQNLPGISKQRLRAYQRLFDLYVYVPRPFLSVVDVLLFMYSRVPLDVQGSSLGMRILHFVIKLLNWLTRKLLIPRQRGTV